jgi:proteasome lid subunit RPN8/RPN11
VTVPRGVLDEIFQHARDASPHECCGVLIGTATTLLEAVRAVNLSDHPSRYEIDPRDHLAARRSARVRGLSVVGYYHSHPHSEPYPSERDRAEAMDDEAVHLIAGMASGVWTARAFRLSKGGVEEVALTLSD